MEPHSPSPPLAILAPPPDYSQLRLRYIQQLVANIWIQGECLRTLHTGFKQSFCKKAQPNTPKMTASLLSGQPRTALRFPATCSYSVWSGSFFLPKTLPATYRLVRVPKIHPQSISSTGNLKPAGDGLKFNLLGFCSCCLFVCFSSPREIMNARKASRMRSGNGSAECIKENHLELQGENLWTQIPGQNAHHSCLN